MRLTTLLLPLMGHRCSVSVNVECLRIKEVIIKYHIPSDEKFHSELKEEGGGAEVEKEKGEEKNLKDFRCFQKCWNSLMARP